MKKIISLLLAVMCLLTAISAFAETTPATVTINAYNAEKVYGEVEVPYDPQRIAVLDMAALDILDSLGLGDRIVGSAKVTIEYLTDYNPDDSEGKIANLGSVKTADMEQVAICEPDVIFIGGRLSKSYADLEVIAPVVYLAVDYEKGVVQSTYDNAMAIASMFGKEADVDALFTEFAGRIDTLKPIVEDTRKKLGDLAKCDEDVLSYIAFPNLAEKFLEERKAKEENVATYSIVEC